MNISERGKKFIKDFEGCRLVAYKCPANVWTIGYGRTYGVYEGLRITQAQADEFFSEDIKRYEAPVQKHEWLNQNQYDALVSFCYNCGAGALADVMSSLDITGTMSKYIRGGGIVLEGLVRRRREEVKLYNTPVKEEEPTKEYSESGVFYPSELIYFRNAPRVSNDNPVKGSYTKGELVIYDRVFQGNGYVWISWYSNSAKVRRYMPIREYTNGKYGTIWGHIK